jgi:transposase-like protein
MDRTWLAAQLTEGRSIESIARQVGRDPSTVAYWVAKHGLASGHAPKHRSRGGLDREQLEAVVETGASTRDIAKTLGVSQATVRHWLRRYGLETPRARQRRQVAQSLSIHGQTVVGTCPRHGQTRFGVRHGGGYRCLTCRAEHVSARRRKVKAILVQEAGGRCALCGYARSPVALQFHHVEPGDKAFSLADGGVARSLASARAEARKCVLLCANCHAEVEAGVATLSLASADDPG